MNAGGMEDDPISDLIGLVRVLDRGRRRHRYGLGLRPRGELVGELGSLMRDPEPDSVRVHQEPDGRLWTDEHPLPTRRASLSTAAEWVLSPVRRRGFGRLDTRVRATAGRTIMSLYGLGDPTQHANGRPAAAHLHGGPAPGRLPLHAAWHPVTGDQLLSTSPVEAEAHGYAQGPLLGYLTAEAPVTGHLGIASPALPWAPRFGRRSATARRGFRGSIDAPRIGAAVAHDHFQVMGWAMTPRGAPSRVEVLLNGEPAGRAALGLPRPDIGRRIDHPDAGVCGFEIFVDPAALPHDEVVVQAVAYAADGSSAPLDAVTVHRLPHRPYDDRDGRAAELRERMRQGTAPPARIAPKQTKVLTLAHNLDHGGAQRYLFDLLRRLSTDPSLAFTVVTPQQGYYGALFEKLGIPVHVTSRGMPRDATEYEGRVAELAAWVDQQGFDLVLANTLDCYLGLDAAMRLDLPSIWSIHESFRLPVWFTLNGAGGRTQQYPQQRAELALGSASALVFAADATRDLYAPYGDPRRLMTMPYGLELDQMRDRHARLDGSALRRARHIPASADVVLCLGTIGPRKGQVALTQAFERVADAHPDALLVIVGEQADAYSAALKSYVKATGLDERVHVEPIDPDPYPWFEIADVFALASNVESSPLSVIEAMTFETPVLATDVFGLSDLVDDGRTGYLCGAGDLDELAAGLDRALTATSAEREALGRAGAEHARARHDPDRYARDFRKLLGEVLESPGRSKASTS